MANHRETELTQKKEGIKTFELFRFFIQLSLAFEMRESPL
jgi:hypothetical protein